MAITFICLKHEAFPQNRIYRVAAVVHCHSATFESRDRSENEHDFAIREASIHQKKVCVGVLTYREIVRRQLFSMCSHSLNRHRKHTLINKVICSIGRNSREEMRRRIVNVAIILFKY